MGFGRMVAIIGMLFAFGMQLSLTAKKFDTIQCSGLEVVDADGNVGMVLDINDHGRVVNTFDKFGNSKNR